MITYKLTKEITLYKNEFDKFSLTIFHSHRLDRLSMDIDALMFRIKYMIKHDKDLDKLDEMKESFAKKSLEMREIFSTFLLEFLSKIIKFENEYKLDDVIDVMANDLKIDQFYVKFTMVLISSNESYLQYIDNTIYEDKPFRMFPNEYFRFFTDSYNDGVSKAYPELFETRQQDKIGTGADADIFVHNFTFQTTERCSLNCTYCFGSDTSIEMSNGSFKDISEIKEGDIVAGFEENPESVWCVPINMIPAKVEKVFKHEAETIKMIDRENDVTTITTRDHKFMTTKAEWRTAEEIINDGDDFLLFTHNRNEDGSMGKTYLEGSSFKIEDNGVQTVYNLQTSTHTYIADGLAAHNCYQFNKSPMRMKFETAKIFIDHLLNDDYGYINRYNSPAIIIEFIGGDPLLEINLTRQIYEYFLDRCYEINHPWFTMHRLSICSNGLAYFDEEVQSFFKDYSSQISFNISIDGNKELHDSCRIQPNGEGSYEIGMMALNHFNKHYSPERNSKMTLSPSNMKYLSDSVIDFIKNDMVAINLNCIFEEGWNNQTALLEYNELKKVANYLIENDLTHLYISIFSDRQEGKASKYMDSPSCGGSGAMLAMRPNGQFYPCLRYMPSSVGNNVKDLCIGNVYDGFIGREQGSEVLKILDRITRRSMSNDICFECPLSNDCANCTALGHTIYGTPDKRTTFICKQNQAEHLANVYYWNILNYVHPEYGLGVRQLVIPDEWAIDIIGKDELDYLKTLLLQSMVSTLQYLKPDMIFE